MHADKIDAKKGNNLFDKASSFDLSIFVFWNIQKVTSSQTIKKKMYPKSKSKMDTKNHEKTIFFTTGQFLFSKYIIIKGLYILKKHVLGL